MPSNSIQRKTRNSFFLGMFVTLILVAIAGALVFLLYLQPKNKETKYMEVYRLKSGVDVKSGQNITASMVEHDIIPVKTENTDFVTGITDGYKSKLDLKEGTILTYNMLYTDEKAQDALRYVEYTCITIPVTLNTNSYVDVRLRLSNGLDLIVVSKKRIQNIFENVVGLNLNEEEILLLNSAIVESYILNGAELYMATYVEPGMQKESTYTYSPTAEVINLIRTNPNIVEEAREKIAGNYANSGFVRNPINDSKSQLDVVTQNSNVDNGMKQQIEDAKQAREKYLSGLVGY